MSSPTQALPPIGQMDLNRTGCIIQLFLNFLQLGVESKVNDTNIANLTRSETILKFYCICFGKSVAKLLCFANQNNVQKRIGFRCPAR